MKKIVLDGTDYEVIRDENEGFNSDAISEKYTDYFASYDYIVGDWAYGKLRLKGFNDKNNKGFKKINDFSLVNEYIDKMCAFGCKWFVLKKTLDKKEK